MSAPIRFSDQRTATTASGASTSGVVDLRDYAILAIRTPSAITAAKFKFQASETKDGTFSDMYDESGALVEVSVGASRVVQLPAAVACAAFLKIVSLDSSSVAVNEAAERTWVILGKS